MKKLRILLLLVCFILCGCTASDNVEPDIEIEAEEIPEEDDEADVVEEEPETTEEVIHEDTDILGNSIGNYANSGLACQADEGMYFSSPYMFAVGLYDGQESKVIYPGILQDISVYDGKLYGISTDPEYNGYIIEEDLENLHTNVLVEDATDMCLANGIIVYTDSNAILHSYNLENNEDTILVDDKVFYPCIYKDMVYYQADYDSERLYCIPLSGGEAKKLSDDHVYLINVYEDKIYFSSKNTGTYSIKCMDLDGNNEEILANCSTTILNIDEDVLYYTDLKDTENLYYIDLNDENHDVNTLPLGEVTTQYIMDCEGAQKEDVVVASYSDLSITDDYLMYCFETVIKGESALGMAFYDRKTDTIPELSSQPHESFDFDTFDRQILEWAAEDNCEEFNRCTGQNYTPARINELLNPTAVVTTQTPAQAQAPATAPAEAQTPAETQTPIVAQAPVQSFSSSDYAYQVIELVNADRAANGLGALSATGELMGAANARATELVSLFSHTRPNGAACSSIMGEYGVGYGYFGENIAMGQPSPYSVESAWMNSEGHRNNILNGTFNHIGVGCYYVNGCYYWVQIFTD